MSVGISRPVDVVYAASASDFVAFARASSEPDCDGVGNNDKQVEANGSGNDMYGRVHSNADYIASGSGNEFFDEVTYGTHDEDCASDADTNTYTGGGPTEIDADPSGVSGGWPGTLASFTTDGWVSCDVGSLSDTSDYVVSLADDGKIICNGSGKITININDTCSSGDGVLNITMVSHGLIEVSGQNNCLSPAAGGENFIAWTDLQTDFAVDFSGSNLNVESSISFTPNAGQKIAGSNDSTVCIQAIGEGPIQFPGSTSAFGPTAPGCDIPEEDTPTPTSTPVTPTSTPVTPVTTTPTSTPVTPTSTPETPTPTGTIPITAETATPTNTPETPTPTATPTEVSVPDPPTSTPAPLVTEVAGVQATATQVVVSLPVTGSEGSERAFLSSMLMIAGLLIGLTGMGLALWARKAGQSN